MDRSTPPQMLAADTPDLDRPPPGTRVERSISAQAAAQGLADRVALALRQALAERGRATLWVSGGSTPVPFFEALSAQDLAWSQVQVGLVDERWCAPTEPDSNEALVRRHLMAGHARSLQWVPCHDARWADPFEAEAGLQAALDACAWPADVVVLGMGGDGHTASWFPDTPQYVAAVSPQRRPRGVAVGAPGLPNVPRPRFTLTLGAVRDCRLICVHVTGAAKAALLGRIWAGEDAPIGHLWKAPWPAVAQGQGQPPIEVHWAP